MELQHDPAKGISVEEDLSGKSVTLTRSRGGTMLTLVALVALMIGGSVLIGDLWSYWFVGFVVVGALLNQVKTRIQFGPRALIVDRTLFGRQTGHMSVPYEAIRALRLEDSTLGRHTLIIEPVVGEPISIHHGEKADHEALRAAIDARRPIQRLPEPEALRAPEALRKLQGQ